MDEFFEVSSSFSNAFHSNAGFFGNDLDGFPFTRLLDVSEEVLVVSSTPHTNMAVVSEYLVRSSMGIARGFDLASLMHPFSSLSICFAYVRVFYQ